MASRRIATNASAQFKLIEKAPAFALLCRYLGMLNDTLDLASQSTAFETMSDAELITAWRNSWSRPENMTRSTCTRGPHARRANRLSTRGVVRSSEGSARELHDVSRLRTGRYGHHCKCRTSGGYRHRMGNGGGEASRRPAAGSAHAFGTIGAAETVLVVCRLAARMADMHCVTRTMTVRI